MPSPHSMEQWFLDLDGVRSGPYQTPEVMSLIAEGEVMPHHRISTTLKNQNWITILDWRLDQAKKINPFQPAEVQEQKHFEPPPLPEDLETLTEELQGDFIPISSYHPPAPPTEREPPPQEEPIADIPAEPTAMEEPRTASKMPSFLTEPEPELEPELEPEPELESHLTPLPEIEANTHPAPTLTPVSRKEEPTSLPISETTQAVPTHKRRDPTAEMFDLIQNTRHKREAKSQSLAQQASVQEQISAATKARSSKDWVKTLGVGVLIVLVGFALGQLFQQHTGIPEKAASEKIASASASASPVNSPAKEPSDEVVDRSTEKMVIRSHVEHREAQAQVKPKEKEKEKDKEKPHAKNQTDKELQELKDLKKELQELKALKEELKNGSLDSQVIPDEEQNGDLGQGNIDPAYNYEPPSGAPVQGSPNNGGYPPLHNRNSNYRN